TAANEALAAAMSDSYRSRRLLGSTPLDRNALAAVASASDRERYSCWACTVSGPLRLPTASTDPPRWTSPTPAITPASTPSTDSTTASRVNRPGVLRARAATRPERVLLDLHPAQRRGLQRGHADADVLRPGGHLVLLARHGRQRVEVVTAGQPAPADADHLVEQLGQERHVLAVEEQPGRRRGDV